LMARSSVSLVMDAFFAASTAMRRRGFMFGSAPFRAATMISLASFVKMRPLAFAVASRFFCFHCAPMTLRIAYPSRERDRRNDGGVSEDFESDLSAWTTSFTDGSAAIAMNPSGPGKALRVQLPNDTTQPQAFLYQNVTGWTDVYIRLFVYREKRSAAADAKPFPFLVLSEVELDLQNNRLVLNQSQPPLVYVRDGQDFPVGSWACVEWMLTATKSTVWVNERQAANVELSDAAPRAMPRGSTWA
jgi:hypothetical protein